MKQYKITIKPKTENKKEFIFGSENNPETIHHFLSTLDVEIGEEIDKIKYIKLEEI